MCATRREDSQALSDPLVDEVRAIRAELVAEFGNDVGRLCNHLREVEREYESRSGRFADLFKLTNEQVIQSWGPDVQVLGDPVIDEVRAIRKARSTRQT